MKTSESYNNHCQNSSNRFEETLWWPDIFFWKYITFTMVMKYSFLILERYCHLSASSVCKGPSFHLRVFKYLYNLLGSCYGMFLVRLLKDESLNSGYSEIMYTKILEQLLNQIKVMFLTTELSYNYSMYFFSFFFFNTSAEM